MLSIMRRTAAPDDQTKWPEQWCVMHMKPILCQYRLTHCIPLHSTNEIKRREDCMERGA